MRTQRIRAAWRGLSNFERWAVFLWSLLLIVSAVRLIGSPDKHTVYPNFTEAASRWVWGSDLYATRGSYDFRYSPLVAIGFIPLLPLGNRIGGVIWCILSVTTLIAAMSWWLKQGTPEPISGPRRGILFLLMLPLTIGNIASDQSNALVLAFVLVAITAVQVDLFSLAAIAIVGAFLYKIYPLSLGLLLILIHPRKMSGRLLLFLAAGLLLPYFFQRPAYVTATYQHWIHYLTVEDRSTDGPGHAYRDLQFLLHDLSIPIVQQTYRLIELGTAAALALLCLIARLKHWPAARLHFFTLTLAVCWMTVFGPATESMTYLLIAPVVCWLLITTRLSLSSWTGYLYLLSYLLLLYPPFAGMFGHHSVLRTPRLKSIQPIAALLLLIGTLDDAVGTRGTERNRSSAGVR